MIEDMAYMPDPEQPEAVKSRPPTLDQHARELYNLPSDWAAYSWFAHGTKETGYVELKGGVFRKKIERGKNKGKTDFRNPEPGTQATFSLANVAHKAWLRLWEMDTGYCAECNGTGLAWAGWDHVKGSAYRPCKPCNATGSAASAKVRQGEDG